MRYNVHPLRAVRHRIARHIGVLVCAALVTALGLPSRAGRRRKVTITDVTYHSDDRTGFTVTWSQNAGLRD